MGADRISLLILLKRLSRGLPKIIDWGVLISMDEKAADPTACSSA
jgi:hypothetical protein